MATPSKSLSKSCFAFKGKRKTIPLNQDVCFGDALVHNTKVRLASYHKQWEKLQCQLKVIQSEINGKMFQGLIDFILNACKSRSDLQHSSIIDIPAAAFITGVNMPDHDPVFAHLRTILQEQVTPYLAFLQSKDCNNLKNFLQLMVSQIMGTKDDFEEDEEGFSIKLQKCNMVSLSAWYNEVARQTTFSRKRSPKKKKRESNEYLMHSDHPLIIILTDFENFLPHVVQDFITICSNYINHLPLVLIFGIATSASTVHRTLSQSVSSLLRMEVLQTQPASKYLTYVLNQLVLNNLHPFKLGSKTFGLLLDIFLCHDFSVSNFFNGYQVCMMEHFVNNPLSILCCEPEELNSRVQDLSHAQLECCRKAYSFRRYVESQLPAEQRALLLDDNHLKPVIIKLLKNLHHFHEIFFPCLSLLHILISNLPQCPFGKHVRELYCTILQTDLSDFDGYKKALKILRIVARDELSDLMENCIKSLDCQENLPHKLHEVKKSLEKLLLSLKNVNDLLEDSCQNDENEEPSPKEKPDTRLKKRKSNPFEKLRSKILDYFEDLFKKYLVSPKTLPLHEVVYFDSISLVKRLLIGAPRAAIQLALSNPQRYFKCDCCENKADSILSSQPDICIAYKLHLECGRLINLYDWLQAFISVLHPEDLDENTKNTLHAQFIRSVSELQFLGFIKPTKAKTDHVARLTWGSC